MTRLQIGGAKKKTKKSRSEPAECVQFREGISRDDTEGPDVRIVSAVRPHFQESGIVVQHAVQVERLDVQHEVQVHLQAVTTTMSKRQHGARVSLDVFFFLTTEREEGDDDGAQHLRKLRTAHKSRRIYRADATLDLIHLLTEHSISLA